MRTGGEAACQPSSPPEDGVFTTVGFAGGSCDGEMTEPGVTRLSDFGWTSCDEMEHGIAGQYGCPNARYADGTAECCPFSADTSKTRPPPRCSARRLQ